MINKNEITVIILAGGKSTRMKSEKGLVDFKGKKLIEHVIDTVSKVSDNIIIITQEPQYEIYGFPCFPDLVNDKGALGGIYTGLVSSGTDKNFVIGCDMPFISENILSVLFNNTHKEDVLLTEHLGKPEPLCSVYDKSCLTHIKSMIEQNQLKVTTAIAGLNTRLISFDNEDWFAGNEFTNINSIDELNKYNF